ncbi:MAG: 16S rRNA (cytidine(1402)-2'-O)-methyltransferase [Syntrophales bacterium]|nr:16S rRNA (cytidine(1402)-2'-O)-methyltransferase [Syntrophales bacterium]
MEKKVEKNKEGKLYIVATPIGNLEDITLRAIRILKEVDLVTAEDTRRTKILFNRYEIRTPLMSLHSYNEYRMVPLIIEKLLNGMSVAYCCDAGTPGISDPGYLLIKKAIEKNLRVVPVPGPSAIITAVSVSGLPMSSFAFLGFLPQKSNKRREILQKFVDEQRTLVFFESPRRLKVCLEDIKKILGNRRVVICLELTKIHERFIRGYLEDVLLEVGDYPLKGEVTVVVEGASEREKVFDPQLVKKKLDELRSSTTLSLRDCIKKVAEELGISKKEVYRVALMKDLP